MNLPDAYQLGVDDLAGRVKCGLVQSIFQRNALGVKTEKPWVFLPLGILGARIQRGQQSHMDPVPYETLTKPEQAAVAFLYGVVDTKSGFVFETLATHTEKAVAQNEMFQVCAHGLTMWRPSSDRFTLVEAEKFVRGPYNFRDHNAVRSAVEIALMYDAAWPELPYLPAP